MIALATGMQHIEIGKLVKEKQLHTGFDEEFQSYLLDDDRIIDELEPLMEQGNCIVDHHGSDFFPERFFELVIVLTCDNTILYDRLKQRNYSEKKIRENLEAEIFGICQEEAKESYKPEIVKVFPSNTVQDMEQVVAFVEGFLNE
ncbi:AAA domain-containing protein [Gorgonomyces haynaldii]|nr:AAA domain-containing protein [Gorgonomyces haynaldii]